MSIIEITSDAKCKDCKFLERVPKIKKDGTQSKQNRLQCSIHIQHLLKGVGFGTFFYFVLVNNFAFLTFVAD